GRAVAALGGGPRDRRDGGSGRPDRVMRAQASAWGGYRCVSTQSNEGSFASMPGRFTAAERDAWAGLLRTHAIMVRRMEEMFRARHQLMYGEFEVLLRLAWAPDHRLRISDLAAASLRTSSAI